MTDEVFEYYERKGHDTNYLKIQEKVLIEYLAMGNNGVNILRLPNYMETVLALVADRRYLKVNTILPDLQLLITYKDIGMKKYEKNVIIAFDEIYQTNMTAEENVKYEEHGKIKCEVMRNI